MIAKCMAFTHLWSRLLGAAVAAAAAIVELKPMKHSKLMKIYHISVEFNDFMTLLMRAKHIVSGIILFEK